MLDPDPAAPLVLRPERGTVHRGDEQLPLTLTEFRLPCELAASAGRVLSRQVLRFGEPRVHLVAEDGAVVPRGRATSGGDLADVLSGLLGELATGPTPAELTDGLSTALRPTTTLAVVDVSCGTATIDLAGPADAPSGRQRRTAVAQLVLTATSLPGVAQVLVARADQQVEAPLPSGELTSRPLTAADHVSLTTAAPPT